MLENHIGFKEINGILVILNPLTSEYFLFSGIERLILNAIILKFSKEEILKKILKTYSISFETAKKDLDLFTLELLNKKILRKVN